MIRNCSSMLVMDIISPLYMCMFQKMQKTPHNLSHSANYLKCMLNFFIYMVYSICSLYLLTISFQPVLHDWCNKGCGMCYPVCWMVHIKEPLLLIRKSSPCGGSRFPLSLSVWYFTICLTPYNHK